jgi:hypothetical protein
MILADLEYDHIPTSDINFMIIIYITASLIIKLLRYVELKVLQFLKVHV